MTQAYQILLVVIDLSDESLAVLERAQQLAQAHPQAQLHVLHTLEPLGFAYGGDLPLDVTSIQEQLDQHARQRLKMLLQDFNIPIAQQHILVGMPDTEAHQLAETIQADVIVVGSHGRHGLQLLLGSVSSGVLHGAPCDVLAVRVGRS